MIVGLTAYESFADTRSVMADTLLFNVWWAVDGKPFGQLLCERHLPNVGFFGSVKSYGFVEISWGCDLCCSDLMGLTHHV